MKTAIITILIIITFLIALTFVKGFFKHDFTILKGGIMHEE